MTALAYTRSGAGARMVLLHGLGFSRRSWDPVVPALAERFDVLAVDLPGFGNSPPLAGVTPVPAALAATVAGLLDDLGIGRAHIVGNSLGGWGALEIGPIRAAPSVALPSPAGVWKGGTPPPCPA